jgi:uncharacterized membrane protein
VLRPVAPTREDGVARAASEVIGGPAGVHLAAGGASGWTAARVVVAMSGVPLVLAVLLRQHCRSTLWASPDQFTHACYSDLPPLAIGSGLDRGVIPYLQSVDGVYLGQPVGTGWLLGVLAWLAPGGREAGRWVFDLGVLAVAAALVTCVLGVLALAGRRPWDASLVALSPVVAVSSLISLDLVAVALAVLGVLAFSRRRAVPAGVLLGLATAVRPLAVLVPLALLLLAARTGRREAPRRTAAAAVVTWLALNLPVLAASPLGWAAYWGSVVRASPGYGSLWLLPQLTGHAVPAGVVRWLSAVLVVLVVVAVAVGTLRARTRPRLPAVVLLLFVGVLLVSMAVPPQASLWLVPFAALAVPRWRDHLPWAAAEVAYATGTWLYLYGQSVPDRGLPAWAYAALLVLRLAAMGWLAWQAVSAVRAPERDPVRSPADAPGLGRDDPAAGPLENAPDALVLRVSRTAGR